MVKKKIGRNDRCPCGSNKKYKTCCLNKKKYDLPSIIAYLHKKFPEKDVVEINGLTPLNYRQHQLKYQDHIMVVKKDATTEWIVSGGSDVMIEYNTVRLLFNYQDFENQLPLLDGIIKQKIEK